LFEKYHDLEFQIFLYEGLVEVAPGFQIFLYEGLVESPAGGGNPDFSL
jgi:hypothetical protein